MKRSFVLLLLVAIALAGCSGGQTPYSPQLGASGPTPTPPPSGGGGAVILPDFSLDPVNFSSDDASPTITLEEGVDGIGTGAFSFRVRSTSTFSGNVALSVGSTESGVTATLDKTSVTPNGEGVLVTMNVRDTSDRGSGFLTVTGTGGSKERSVSLSWLRQASGVAVAVSRVSPDGPRVFTFDAKITVTQGGRYTLGIDRTYNPDLAYRAIPDSVPIDGLPANADFAVGESKTFRVTVTMPNGLPTDRYGFGVTAQKEGSVRKTYGDNGFLYSGSVAN